MFTHFVSSTRASKTLLAGHGVVGDGDGAPRTS